MKFTVNKKDIAEAVSNIQRAVSTKTSIPALEGILLTAQDTTLELCAYDMELGITTVIPAQAVSYTHLDVYKRQQYTHAPWQGRLQTNRRSFSGAFPKFQIPHPWCPRCV